MLRWMLSANGISVGVSNLEARVVLVKGFTKRPRLVWVVAWNGWVLRS